MSIGRTSGDFTGNIGRSRGVPQARGLLARTLGRLLGPWDLGGYLSMAFPTCDVLIIHPSPTITNYNIPPFSTHHV